MAIALFSVIWILARKPEILGKWQCGEGVNLEFREGGEYFAWSKDSVDSFYGEGKYGLNRDELAMVDRRPEGQFVPVWPKFKVAITGEDMTLSSGEKNMVCRRKK